MDSKTRLEVRRATQRRRRPPAEPRRIELIFDGDGELGDELVPAPVQITIEATSTNGELAGWLDDSWWTEVIQRWGDEPLTIRIAPTSSALLHVVLLHQVEMLKRVVPAWRVVGHAFRNDLAGEEDIRQLAASAYDEVRFTDQTRPGMGSGRVRGELRLDELFGQIRREQARIGTTRPILIRMPGPAPPCSSTSEPVSKVSTATTPASTS